MMEASGARERGARGERSTRGFAAPVPSHEKHWRRSPSSYGFCQNPVPEHLEHGSVMA